MNHDLSDSVLAGAILAGKESFATTFANVAGKVAGLTFAVGAIPFQRMVGPGAEIEVVVVLEPFLAALKGGAPRLVSTSADVALIRLY